MVDWSAAAAHMLMPAAQHNTVVCPVALCCAMRTRQLLSYTCFATRTCQVWRHDTPHENHHIPLLTGMASGSCGNTTGTPTREVGSHRPCALLPSGAAEEGWPSSRVSTEAALPDSSCWAAAPCRPSQSCRRGCKARRPCNAMHEDSMHFSHDEHLVSC